MEVSGFIGFAAVMGCILIAMVVHEFMHAYVGYKLGDATAKDEGRLTLNPLKHIDPFTTVLLPAVAWFVFGFLVLAAKPVPFNPYKVKYQEYGAALIAAAGPLSNLALAIITSLVYNATLPSGFVGALLDLFVGLNVALFVFNLIPIPPLDGSRILYAFAPEPLQEFMQKIEPYGFFIIIGLIMVGGFGSVIVHINQSVLNLLP
jgi:Zn-dependent protease